MKIAILNFSGNIGKTTIATSLLKPRLPNTPYLAIETINDGANGEKKIDAGEYGVLLDEMLMMDDMIIDIGSSNVETTMKKIQQYKNSHEIFDYFLVPVTPGTKQQIDTKSTLLELIELGVKPSKIRLVFNMVNNQAKLERDFETVINAAKMLKIKVPSVGMEENEVYEKLRTLNKNIEEVLAIKDIRKQMKETEDMAKRRELATLYGVQMLAETAKENLDNVFKDLAL